MLDDESLQEKLQKPTFNAAAHIWGPNSQLANVKKKPAAYLVPAVGKVVAQSGQLTVSSTIILNHTLSPTILSLISSTSCEIQVPESLKEFFVIEYQVPGSTEAPILKGEIKAANSKHDFKLFWMFTCSYNRAERSCLDRREVMQPLQPGQYAQVLVVRKEQRQFYSRRFGASHIIVTLPEEMTLRYGEISKDMRPCMRLKVTAGIGYARLFSQLLAHSLGLKHIWVRRDRCGAY